jgi:hypothetical protein
MEKEHWVVFAAGLFILSYVLDAVVEPLKTALESPLTSPYQYFNPEIMGQYPFTTASIFIKALGLLIVVSILLSFMERKYIVKSVITIVLLALMQLYAVQDVISRSEMVTLEWDLGIALGGIFLVFLLVFYFFKGIFQSLYTSGM